jgi:DNA (cytosine-5)-methyltransferase 1
VKPLLLDLFCGAGGCTKGYQRAGFDVVGVDIKPQPNYCGDDFIEGDALILLAGYVELGTIGEFYAAIHASPPCQAYTHAKYLGNRGRDDHPDLLAATRDLLRATGLPYVIENVPDSPMVTPVTLCGSSVGLPDLERHRWFETNWPLMAPPCAHGVRGAARFKSTPKVDGSERMSRIVNAMSKHIGHEQFAEAMGIDWIPARGFRPTDELRNAIPPVYTELIGHQLMSHIGAAAA